MSDDYPRCFFVGQGPCSGQLIKAHLIQQQTLRREFPDRWKELADDPRSWIPCCGGINGSSGHHGQLDVARTLRIPLEALPLGFLTFCDELGLGWYVDRYYGPNARRDRLGR